MKNKPILHLNLKKKWFDMILSGEKKEEYREIKKSWSNIFLIFASGPKIKIKRKEYSAKNVIICFSNGYAKDRRQFFIECKNIHVGYGREEWGAEKDKIYYVLKLGSIVTP